MNKKESHPFCSFACSRGELQFTTQLVITYLSNPTLSNWHIPHTGDRTVLCSLLTCVEESTYKTRTSFTSEDGAKSKNTNPILFLIIY
jgi:hypothetical protein